METETREQRLAQIIREAMTIYAIVSDGADRDIAKELADAAEFVADLLLENGLG